MITTPHCVNLKSRMPLFTPGIFRFWHLKISQLKTIYCFVEIWCWISHGSRLLQHAPLMWKTSCFQCMQLALDVSEFSAAILNDVSKSSDITDSQRNIGHHISNLLVNAVNVDGWEPIGVRTQICRPGGDYAYQHLNNWKIVHIFISHWDKKELTHWDRVTHICVNELTIIVSDNGLWPGGRQAII